MKEGWTYKKIKDVGEVIGGTTPSTNNPEFWGGDICWISPAELHGEHYLYNSVKKITTKAVKAKSLKELPVGTVILSSRAPIGKIAINKVPMYCNQGFKCVVCGPELYNEYLYWWFYGKKEYLNSLGTGATFPEISKTVVENIVIPVAPLSEQKSIVARLDAAFAHIDALKENAEKQLTEARKLFQAELAECMRPKEGWVHKKLGDVCYVVGGGTPDTKNKDYWGGSIPWATVSDMNCEVIKSTGYSITGRGLDESSSRIIKAGEIIIATRVGLGKVCKLAIDTAINQDLKGIIPKENNILKDFIFYYFKNKANYIVNNGIGATVKGVKIKFIESLSFDYPPSPEQQKIIERLDALSANIKKLEEVLRKTQDECDALKQAILREVFE